MWSVVYIVHPDNPTTTDPVVAVAGGSVAGGAVVAAVIVLSILVSVVYVLYSWKLGENLCALVRVEHFMNVIFAEAPITCSTLPCYTIKLLRKAVILRNL